MTASPDRSAFRALVRAGNTIVPVWRELLADLTTPVAAFTRVVGSDPGGEVGQQLAPHRDNGVARSDQRPEGGAIRAGGQAPNRRKKQEWAPV